MFPSLDDDVYGAKKQLGQETLDELRNTPIPDKIYLMEGMIQDLEIAKIPIDSLILEQPYHWKVSIWLDVIIGYDRRINEVKLAIARESKRLMDEL